MDYKIVQIIPAISNMYALYKNQIDGDEMTEIKNKIVCLALIEYDDGEREVIPMDITDGDGEIGRVGEDLERILYS